MATNLFKFCPHCRGIYEQGPQELSIGVPVIACRECNGLIVDTDRTEWELKSPLGKAVYFVLCGWTAFFWGLAFPMGAYFLGQHLGFRVDNEAAFSLWLIGSLFFLGVLILGNLNDVRASQERMKDPQYRELLRQAGLLKRDRPVGRATRK